MNFLKKTQPGKRRSYTKYDNMFIRYIYLIVNSTIFDDNDEMKNRIYSAIEYNRIFISPVIASNWSKIQITSNETVVPVNSFDINVDSTGVTNGKILTDAETIYLSKITTNTDVLDNTNNTVVNYYTGKYYIHKFKKKISILTNCIDAQGENFKNWVKNELRNYDIGIFNEYHKLYNAHKNIGPFDLTIINKGGKYMNIL